MCKSSSAGDDVVKGDYIQGLQIKMIITITIVSDQYRNTKD